MKISVWQPKDSLKPKRIYLSDGISKNDVYIAVKKGYGLIMFGDCQQRCKLADLYLKSHDVDFTEFKSIPELVEEMTKKKLFEARTSENLLVAKSISKHYETSLTLPITDLSRHEFTIQIAKKNEWLGKELEAILAKPPKVSNDLNSTLKLTVTNTELVFQVINIQELGELLKSNEAYLIAEELHALMIENADKGLSTKVFWVIESTLDKYGSVASAYDVAEMDTFNQWLCFVTSLAEQHFYHTISKPHTVSTITRIINFFASNELPVPVKVKNQRIDLTAKERRNVSKSLCESFKHEHDTSTPVDYNVGLSGVLDKIPLISNSVAINLAKTGKSLAEITAMSESELLKVHGIGKQTATMLYNVFHNIRS